MIAESFTRKDWHSSSGSTLCSHSKIVQEEKDCLSVFFSTFTVLKSITMSKIQLIRYHNKGQCSHLILNVHYFISWLLVFYAHYATVKLVVHLHGVEVGTGFIQQQDSGPTEDGSSQTQQLLVAVAQHMTPVFQLKI